MHFWNGSATAAHCSAQPIFHHRRWVISSGGATDFAARPSRPPRDKRSRAPQRIGADEGNRVLARPVSVGRIDPTMNPADENVGVRFRRPRPHLQKILNDFSARRRVCRGSDKWNNILKPKGYLPSPAQSAPLRPKSDLRRSPHRLHRCGPAGRPWRALRGACAEHCQPTLMRLAHLIIIRLVADIRLTGRLCCVVRYDGRRVRRDTLGYRCGGR